MHKKILKIIIIYITSIFIISSFDPIIEILINMISIETLNERVNGSGYTPLFINRLLDISQYIKYFLMISILIFDFHLIKKIIKKEVEDEKN